MPTSLTKVLLLFFMCVLSSGCSTTELPSVLRWSKTEVGIGARSVGEVEQILWQVQQDLLQLNITSIWTEQVEPHFLVNMVVEEQCKESLFLSTWWLEGRQDLGDDTHIRARLSFSISEAKIDLGDGITSTASGDIRVEAIFSGVYSLDLEKDYVDELAHRIVLAVVRRMNALLSDTAESAGAWATILSHDGTK